MIPLFAEISVPLLIAIGLAAILLGALWYTHDDETEERHRAYLKVADVLRDEFGLVDIPTFMDDIALSDYDRAFFKVKKLADDFQHQDKVEFLVNKAFNRILDAQLKKPDIVAKLRERLAAIPAA